MGQIALRRIPARAALAGFLAAGLAGCGASSASPSVAVTPAGPVFNQADVDFAARMSQHHGQALQMAEMAQRKARGRAVRDLACGVVRDRAPELDQFGAWLAAWGEAGAEMSPHGIGGDHGVPGMLRDAELARLGSASGASFDRLFLTLMVRHHRGGQALARQQLKAGRNDEALELARSIQQAEAAAVTAMLQLRQSMAP